MSCIATGNAAIGLSETLHDLDKEITDTSVDKLGGMRKRHMM
jgi:hypothetical protein